MVGTGVRSNGQALRTIWIPSAIMALSFD